MTFTDDDLKRLKLRLSADYFVRNKFVDAQEMEALLARLEAAEQYIDAIEINGFNDPETRIKENLWHKAAGK